MKATVLLIATVISLSASQVRLEEPLGDLLRVGDVGTIFYELRVGEEQRIVEVGRAEVSESTQQRTVLEVGHNSQVKTGHQARFEVPLAGLSPSDLVRLVELGIEEDLEPADDSAVSELEDSAASGTELPQDLGGPVLSLIDAWLGSWQDQDVDGYLACYSQDFQPADGSTLKAWRVLRTRRIEAPEFIEVALDDIQFEPVADGETRVLFNQMFRSDDYQDSVRKELILRQDAAGWRILREHLLP